MAKPLSSLDIDNFLKGYSNKSYITYEELANVSDIKNIFSGHFFRILIYESKTKEIGHWVLLLQRSTENGVIEYFDSYGNDIDIADHLINGTKRTILADLIKRSKSVKKVIINRKVLQRGNVPTCGKWVLHRLLSCKIQLKEYVKIMEKIEKFINLDDFVNKFINIPNKT